MLNWKMHPQPLLHLHPQSAALLLHLHLPLHPLQPLPSPQVPARRLLLLCLV